MHHNILHLITGLVTSLLISAASAQTQTAGQNLLQNGSFSAGKDRSVMRWVFPQSPLKALGDNAEKVSWGSEADSEGNRYAAISLQAPCKAHLWWQQEVTAEAGSTYQLSVRIWGDVPSNITAEGKQGYAASDIGIYFLDATNKWIGYQRLPNSSFSPEWKTVTLKATAPDNAAKIGVRLGVSANVEVKARFDDAILVLADE